MPDSHAEQYIEVDNIYITNQPLIGGLPDPAHPPTVAYLFCHEPKAKRPFKKRWIYTIEARNQAELEDRVANFCLDKVLVNMENPDAH